jgi:flavin reductase (DIM6/NTAB) family NADH-FMN oxidoreductase RutF
MKTKTLTFGIFAALLLTACGNKANESETEAKTTTSDQWQEIKPQDIDVNAVKMFADDWMLLSAGKDTSMNMMTIAWGALGELWGKPVVTVYVSTDRYTYKFLEDNEYFTVTAFPEQFRDKLQYLGSVSGRDEDKVKGSGLTPEFTKLGNPIYKEANLAIECKKIYAEQFKKELMPLEQRQWYDEKKQGVHVMYIGEIVNVWKK